MKRDWVETEDGTHTLRAANGEYYNDMQGGLCTAFSAFAQAGGLLVAGDRVQVLDVGFGLGLNATAAWATLRDIGAELMLTAIEPDADILDAFAEWPAPFSLRAPREDIGAALAGKRVPGLSVRLLPCGLEDAADRIAASYHAIFFDPWSPATQPALWQPDLLADLYRRLRPGGSLAARAYGSDPLAPLHAADLPAEAQCWPGGAGQSVRAKKPK